MKAYPANVAQGTSTTPVNPTNWNGLVDGITDVKEYQAKGVVFDVAAYGATGAGSADDSDAFDSAIAAATVSGGVLLLPPGTYKLSDDVTIPADVTVVFLDGAQISVDNTKTFAFSDHSGLQAGIHHIFAGAGSVTIGTGVIEYIHPEWFGAIADGSTACKTAINAAITAIGTGGKIVLLEGVYIAEGISLLAGQTLSGVGFGTQLYLPDGADDAMIDTHDNTIVSNLSIDMNKDNNASGSAVKIISDSNVLVENCYLENAQNYGILIWDSDQIRIINNVLSENWRGIDLDEWAGSGVGNTNVEIIGNQLKATDLNLCKIEHSNEVRVLGNSFTQLGTGTTFVLGEGGDAVPPTKDVTIKGNTFTGGYFNIDDVPNCSVIVNGNAFRDCYVQLDTAETIDFSHNTIHNAKAAFAIDTTAGSAGFTSITNNEIIAGADSTQDGIILRGGAKFVCESNFISGFLRYGIWILNNNCSIRYNVIQGDNNGGTAVDEGIFIQDRTAGEIVGNEIYNAERGIEIDACTGIIIRNNYLHDLDATGIRENGACANILADNRYSNVTGADLTTHANTKIYWDDLLTSISGPSPELLFKNLNLEDGSGERESDIRFKGYQTGGELTTLARILGAHDGTGDDEKGKIDFFVNTGAEGNSPTKMLNINNDGSVNLLLGVLGLVETTTPPAVGGRGKIYTKNDNNIYFQDGAGVEHTILKGATGIEHTYVAPLEDPTGTVGNWDVVSIGTAQSVHFALQVPEDFEFLDAANVIIIPDANETIQWDVLVSVSAAGEAYNADDRSALNETLVVTINLLTEVDISGVLTGLAAGDYIAIDFQSDTANIRVVGFEFDYN